VTTSAGPLDSGGHEWVTGAANGAEYCRIHFPCSGFMLAAVHPV